MEWIDLEKLIGVALDFAGPVAIGGNFAVVGTYVGTSVYAMRHRTTLRDYAGLQDCLAEPDAPPPCDRLDLVND